MRTILTPASRNTDPYSSHAAEAEINKTGLRSAQHKSVLDLVNRFPGCTSDELAKHGGIDRHQTGRRLPELETGGYVYRGPFKRSFVTGRLGISWHPKTDQLTLRLRP